MSGKISSFQQLTRTAGQKFSRLLCGKFRNSCYIQFWLKKNYRFEMAGFVKIEELGIGVFRESPAMSALTSVNCQTDM